MIYLLTTILIYLLSCEYSEYKAKHYKNKHVDQYKESTGCYLFNL